VFDLGGRLFSVVFIDINIWKFILDRIL
jgi:hypothetical protein